MLLRTYAPSSQCKPTGSDIPSFSASMSTAKATAMQAARSCSCAQDIDQIRFIGGTVVVGEHVQYMRTKSVNDTVQEQEERRRGKEKDKGEEEGGEEGGEEGKYS